jgi:rhodanese-related sulfurtransferase
MKELKSVFIYAIILFLVSINLSLAYANNAVPTIGASGIGLTQPFHYAKINAEDLNNLLLNNANNLNIIDIRSKEVFENLHLEASKHLNTEELSNLLVNTSLDIGKPVLIIGEDTTQDDFFAKMASFYGYEAIVFEDDVSSLNGNVKLVSGADVKKDVNQVDTQAFINAAKVAIDGSTKALIELSQNLDSMINNNLVNTEVVQNVINSIINQINKLRENPITGMFFPTDQSVGDVLSDIFRDDRKIRNRAHAEGVSDALNLIGGNISRRDTRRMSRNQRFEKRQIVGTANDLKGQGYNEAVIDVLNEEGQSPSRLNQSLRN